MKWLVTIANRNNLKKMKHCEVLVLVDALYLDASVNDKVNTMTLHQAYDIVAGRLGLVKLDKVQKTAIKEWLWDLVNGKVIATVGGTEGGGQLNQQRKGGLLAEKKFCPFWATTHHSSSGKGYPITSKQAN